MFGRSSFAKVGITYEQNAEPKGTHAIALRLNQRPRKTLGFETPADRLQAVLR